MKIKKKTIEMFILTMCVFKPLCMDFFTVTSWFYKIVSLASFAYICLKFINLQKKPFLQTNLIIFLEGITLFSTIIYHGNIDGALWKVISLVYIAMLVDISVKEEKIELLIRNMMIHLELCTYINALTVLFKPNGFFSRSISAYGKTQEWFLGSDHYFIIWAVPAFLISWIFKEYTGEKYRCYILCIVTVAIQFIRGSATGIVGVMIFTIWLVIPWIKKFMTPIKSMLIASILLLAVVFLRNADFLEPLIVNVLGKDMTFTSRLGIWDNAIKAIIEKPIIGHGILYSNQIVEQLGQIGEILWKGATHCHCQILQVMFQSGIVGLICYLTVIIISFSCYKKYIKTSIAQVGTICLFIFCVISITEVYEYPQMYLLFIVPCYLKKILNDIDLKHCKYPGMDGNAVY